MAPTATAEEIGRAYRALMRRHHPDSREAENPAAHDEALARVMEAYELLNDPGRRAAYDRAAAAGRQPAVRPVQPFSRSTGQRPVTVRGSVEIRVGPTVWTRSPGRPAADADRPGDHRSGNDSPSNISRSSQPPGPSALDLLAALFRHRW